ncbi:MAG: electron transfer flavoprotein subunit beta/FixA family protein [Candidatus Promineifilaceae bacterium]
MKAVVCVKQTPTTTAVYRVEDGIVKWDDPTGGKPHVVNPWDEYAIEETIRLKENHGASEAIALTVGDGSANSALKTCLAMGCTSALLVSDDSLAGSGGQGTARALAAAIKHTEASIAVFGKQAIDGDTGMTTIMTARALGWTPLTYVSAIKEISDDTITVERMLERGVQTVTAKMPVVISVVKEANEPRYPSFMGIRKANRATIPTVSADDIGVEGEVGEDSSKVDWSNVYAPPTRVMETEMITGASAEEIAATLADRLMDEKVI